MSELVLEHLKRTRGLLSKPYAWCKGKYSGINFDKKGNGYRCFCLLGAINQTDKVNTSSDAAHSLSQALPPYPNCKAENSIIGWNDAPTTHKKDVLALLDQAIKDLENELH